MAKNQYIGVGNVARKVKQPYIGVNNVARKVKSGFVGVNNVARQYYESVVYNTWKRYSFSNVNFYRKVYSNSSDIMYLVNRFGFYNGTTPPSCAFCIDLATSGSLISISNISGGVNLQVGTNGLKSVMISNVQDTSQTYYRYSDSTYHNDQYVGLSGYPSTRYDSAYAIIPGWEYNEDAIVFYDTYQQYVRTLSVIYNRNPDSCVLTFYEDDDGSVGWLAQSTENVSTVVAPQGTYPDNGLHTD